MLQKFRRHAHSLLRPLLALAIWLWLVAALAPCFVSSPHCDGMDGAMTCTHAGAPSDCDTACLQGDCRNAVAAIASLPDFVPPLLLAVIALIIRPPVAARSIVVTPRRAPDTPLHLQLARLLI